MTLVTVGAMAFGGSGATTVSAAVPEFVSTAAVGPTSRLPVAGRGQQKALVRPVVFITSPWFPGVRFIGINYGCNPTPYYPHDGRCSGRQGFHHGVDVSMPKGTPIYSNVSGTIIKGGTGNGYGSKAFRIRTSNRDILLGHVSRVVVRAGQRVKPGQLIAYSGNLGAPDGSHLHFEVRPKGATYVSAVNPMSLLAPKVVARIA